MGYLTFKIFNLITHGHLFNVK